MRLRQRLTDRKDDPRRGAPRIAPDSRLITSRGAGFRLPDRTPYRARTVGKQTVRKATDGELREAFGSDAV